MTKRDWWRFILKILLCTIGTWLAYQYILTKGQGEVATVVALATTAPLWGILFATDIRDFIIWIKHRGESDALEPWNGRYYSFDGHHVRIVLVDDCVWIPIADLQAIFYPRIDQRELRLLGTHHAAIPGTKIPGVDENGLQTLLKNRTEHRRAEYQMIRFKRWLYTEAVPNLRRLPQSSA